MENDAGAGPATPASPAHLASKDEKPTQIEIPMLWKFRSAAIIELTQRGPLTIPFAPAEQDESADAEVEAEFRRKLMGLRGLSRNERTVALRAARNWRFVALQQLREKRAADRHARYALWRSQLSMPKHP